MSLTWKEKILCGEKRSTNIQHKGAQSPEDKTRDVLEDRVSRDPCDTKDGLSMEDRLSGGITPSPSGIS